MAKKKTRVKTYLCQVDVYRNGMVFRDNTNRLYDRNTKGTYIVGAKSDKEAKQLLQKHIRFGSVNVCRIALDMPQMEHGQIRKREWADGKEAWTEDFPCATDPVEKDI